MAEKKRGGPESPSSPTPGRGGASQGSHYAHTTHTLLDAHLRSHAAPVPTHPRLLPHCYSHPHSSPLSPPRIVPLPPHYPLLIYPPLYISFILPPFLQFGSRLPLPSHLRPHGQSSSTSEIPPPTPPPPRFVPPYRVRLLPVLALTSMALPVEEAEGSRTTLTATTPHSHSSLFVKPRILCTRLSSGGCIRRGDSLLIGVRDCAVREWGSEFPR